jgi:nucleoside-diphosphate-sugar epimerase
MNVAVIGGTGHIGSYLVPRLVEAGHDVTCVSRGQRDPYRTDEAWKRVRLVTVDRVAEETKGTFGATIAKTQPEVVVDLTCFTLESAVHLVGALRGALRHFLHCGTIWVHGHSVRVPTTEDQPRKPLGDYGRGKVDIEVFLLAEAGNGGFPATILHPGHLVGTGWAPINPVGNFDVRVFEDLAAGRELVLPNFGMETLHHVHADDVAQAFVRTIERGTAAAGHSFHVVSGAALTLRGYAEGMAEWVGREPRLRFVPWDEWRQGVAEKDATITFNHLCHSSNCSIARARTVLGYEPRYSSLEAVQEAVRWLADNGRIRW